MAKNAVRRLFPAKPEVEIWRKPEIWTPSHRFPIRSPVLYGVYVDAKCLF